MPEHNEELEMDVNVHRKTATSRAPLMPWRGAQYSVCRLLPHVKDAEQRKASVKEADRIGDEQPLF